VADPLAPTIGERIRRSRTFLLASSCGAAVMGTAAYFMMQVQETPPTFEQATVLSFGMSSGEDGNHPFLRVMTTSEGQRTIRVEPRVFRSCAKGDLVLLQRRGMNLRVAPEACKLPDNKE